MTTEAIGEYNHTNRIISAVAFSELSRRVALLRLHFNDPARGGTILDRKIDVAVVPLLRIAAALMLLRTYALYVRDRRVLALLLALIGIGVSVSVWVLVVGHLTERPTIAHSATLARAGCILVLSQEEGDDLAIAWSAIMVFDVAVFILTVLQALQVRETWCGGYFGVILRDGTAYFAILFLCYLSNILSYTLAQPMYKSISTTITNVVSTTLITRLMLNIRDPELRGAGPTYCSPDEAC
ncbi:hypothetical protein VTO73DRAFT_11116 [Trametes versicolor]